MAETLGSLCDKLTILELKRWHAEQPAKLASLAQQITALSAELDEYLAAALAGTIPVARLTFAANKVFKAEGNTPRAIAGSIGQVLAELAQVNCALWHEQEKVYEFERVPPADKDRVVKRLAVLNLERNHCIDAIDRTFQGIVQGNLAGSPR